MNMDSLIFSVTIDRVMVAEQWKDADGPCGVTIRVRGSSRRIEHNAVLTEQEAWRLGQWLIQATSDSYVVSPDDIEGMLE